MTVQEFNNLFDIHYNNIAGQSNPDLDVFEKSNYLTTAQLEIIKNYYDPQSNRKQKSFENTEKRRRDLNQLVQDYKSSVQVISSKGIHNNSKFFVIPKDTLFIVNEKVVVSSTDCDNGKAVSVKPITHDEFNTNINNPFKNPDNNVAWRLDISNISNNKVVEIISPYKNLEYQIRYIKYPKPIILEDLATAYPNENLSIDGQTIASTSELNESIHREILDRAVELALLDYKPQDLQGKVQLDVRNE
ncbi:MAG TPA: hypothetical protein VF680_16840 [Allosphingosinicella sp.]|jgi:hypothetical protein